MPFVSRASSRSMAFLVFLPAAARAGVIAADFLIASLNRLWRNRFFSAVENERREWARNDGWRWGCRLYLVSNCLYMKESVKRIGLNPFHHAGKEIVAFALVLDK